MVFDDFNEQELQEDIEEVDTLDAEEDMLSEDELIKKRQHKQTQDSIEEDDDYWTGQEDED